MKEQTIFPREEHADVLFQKILADPWACDKLFETFCNDLFSNDELEDSLSADEFCQALFRAYRNRDLSAFLMAISKNTLFDLIRNSYLIPYRFNADGKTNPVIMTDENGVLLPEFKNCIHEKEYQHFREVYNHFDGKKKMYLAQAYRYSHSYRDDDMNIKQQVLEKNTGVLLIRELPDTIKLKETESEAYCAVWDLMIQLEKELPMAFVFYGQDSLIEQNNRYDELGIFLPNSHFLKNLERHAAQSGGDYLWIAQKIQPDRLLMLILWKKNHMEIPWHDYAKADSNVLIENAGLIEKASVIGRVGLMMLSCGTGAWRVRTSMNRLSKELGVTCTVDVGLMSIEFNCFDGTDCVSQSLSIANTGVNTSKLYRMEQFVERFPEEKTHMTGEQIHKKLDTIEKIHTLYSPAKLGFAAALACCAFTFLLGGGPVEMILAFIGRRCRKCCPYQTD